MGERLGDVPFLLAAGHAQRCIGHVRQGVRQGLRQDFLLGEDSRCGAVGHALVQDASQGADAGKGVPQRTPGSHRVRGARLDERQPGGRG